VFADAPDPEETDDAPRSSLPEGVTVAHLGCLLSGTRYSETHLSVRGGALFLTGVILSSVLLIGAAAFILAVEMKK
jgi:hypothetical protein